MKTSKTISVLGMALGFLVGGSIVSKAQADFIVPNMENWQEVTSVIVREKGNDVVVDLKNSPDGPALKTFLLKDKKSAVESFDYGFQLNDGGQYFSCADLKVRVMGGKGDDFIVGKAGSRLEGNDGNDILRLVGTDNGGLLDGGRGDDDLEGSDGNDTLDGGDGDDFIMAHQGADTANGGEGDDTLLFADYSGTADPSSDLNDDVADGGSGNDQTDELGSPTGVEVEASNPDEAIAMSFYGNLILIRKKKERLESYVGGGPKIKALSFTMDR